MLTHRIAFRRSLWTACLLLGAATAWGQGPAAPAPAPVTTAFAPRSYTIDAALFVGLVGAALFAVCRSSQRG
jgi:hypothetical protein